MKLHRDFAHSGLSHAELQNLEWIIEIMCAVANVPIVCPFQQLPQPGLTPSAVSHQFRLDFFADLYSKDRRHMPLIDFSLCAAKVSMQPPDSLRALWNILLQNFPTDISSIKSLLMQRAERILRAISGENYCSKQLQYSKAAWTHEYPDRRARALVRSHYVQLVQLCSKPTLDGRSELFVQAAVHPSERNSLVHYARISTWQTLRGEGFSLLTSQCSCEDGYAQH